MKMIKYPSTGQFRSIIKQVSERAQFVSYDEETKEIQWNKEAILPTIKFHGTVKIHGTQGAIVLNPQGEIHYQSRKNIVTPEKDNAGFAFFCTSRKEIFDDYFQELRALLPDSAKDDSISIYGEFFGGNIQKGVMINGINKSFAIFGIKISPKDEDKSSFWIDSKILKSRSEKNIYNIEDFRTYNIEIDFNDKVRLAEAQNEMSRLTTLVGDECPVGKILNPDSEIKTGEGIVWCYLEDGERLIFKTKDERHSKSKVKVPKVIDIELEKIKKDFIETYACTESRMNQMYTEIIHSVHNGDESLMEMKDIGLYLRLIYQDIIKEEIDKLSELNLEPKSINGAISLISKKFFINKLNDIG